MTTTSGTLTVMAPWGAVSPAPQLERPTPSGPRLRALLEARWRARLQEVTELSLAFHDAAASARHGPAGHAEPQVRRLVGQAISARQALADTHDALGRLAAGRYGQCESCLAGIPGQTLREVPEARYCPRCAGEPAPHRQLANA
jgi:RNA polymerase-binding transcription factor DksA